jgi:hypothetical protein
MSIAARRWEGIAAGQNPQLGVDVPGLPTEEIAAEVRKFLAGGSAS